MGFPRFVFYIKRTIAIALLIIISSAVISHAAIDIDALYTEVTANTDFMTKLYEAGAQQEVPVSSDEVDARMRKFVTYVMNEAEKEIELGNITKINYVDEIKAICFNLIRQVGLDTIITTAFPTVINDFLSGRVPEDLQPLYNAIGKAVYLQLDIGSLPEPSLEPTPSVEPSPSPTPTTPLGGNGNGNGGGGIKLPVVSPTAIPTIEPSPTPTVSPAEASDYFIDLQNVDWAVAAIGFLTQAGVISENTEKKFEPLNNVKREEFVKLIVCAFDFNNPNANSSFFDVGRDSWFYLYVSSMAELGLVKGFNDNSFGAGNDITRQDIAVLLYRIIQHMVMDVTLEEPVLFEDDSEMSDYAKNAVYIMRQLGIIRGTRENTFEPTDFATRAEAAQMIYNAYNIYMKK